MTKQLEICCFNPESAIIADNAGADRIELCDNIYDGGTTPSYGVIKYVRKNVKTKLNIIIRPRGGDFNYSSAEFEIMQQDIQMCKELDIDGVVLGLLNKNMEVDIERTSELVELAKPMSVTFHRAFDLVNNPQKALEDVVKTGSDRILTSGCKSTANEGIELLAELVKQAGNRIIIMPGAGINEHNIYEIASKTNAIEFHSSTKVFIKSQSQSINNVGLDDVKNNSIGHYLTDAQKIKEIKKRLV